MCLDTAKYKILFSIVRCKTKEEDHKKAGKEITTLQHRYQYLQTLLSIIENIMGVISAKNAQIIIFQIK